MIKIKTAIKDVFYYIRNFFRVWHTVILPEGVSPEDGRTPLDIYEDAINNKKPILTACGKMWVGDSHARIWCRKCKRNYGKRHWWRR